MASPWSGLRGGLVLGAEALWKKTLDLVRAKAGRQELRWHQHASAATDLTQRARALATQETDRRLRVWLRVTLGGERRSAVARDLGYADPSAITHLLKRLGTSAALDSWLLGRIKAYEQTWMSNVKR